MEQSTNIAAGPSSSIPDTFGALPSVRATAKWTDFELDSSDLPLEAAETSSPIESLWSLEVNGDEILEYRQDTGFIEPCDDHWSKIPIGENEMNTLKGAHGDETPRAELLLGEDEMQQAEIVPAERAFPVMQHLPSARNPSTGDGGDVMATVMGEDENDLQANDPTGHDGSEAQHSQDEVEVDTPADPTVDDAYESFSQDIAKSTIQSGRSFWKKFWWSCVCGKRHA